jgi:hypothetical protein
MSGDDDITDRTKHGEFADLPRVREHTRSTTEVGRDLLERSQRFLHPPHLPRTREARQVVQEHIDDQKALMRKLRRQMN